jgi:hypothetical protein
LSHFTSSGKTWDVIGILCVHRSLIDTCTVFLTFRESLIVSLITEISLHQVSVPTLQVFHYFLYSWNNYCSSTQFNM